MNLEKEIRVNKNSEKSSPVADAREIFEGSRNSGVSLGTIEYEKEANKRITAIRNLSDLDSKEAHDFLVTEGLRDLSPRVRYAALEELLRIAIPEDLVFLEQIKETPFYGNDGAKIWEAILELRRRFNKE